MDISRLKDMVQDCNINFLLGSGLSVPYLSTLGIIEDFLTELTIMKDSGELKSEQEKIIRASMYKLFFDIVIVKNIDILENDTRSLDVLNDYKKLLKTINSILLKRKSTILNKQINLFTTNIDIFLEKSLEGINVEFSDGFNGRFNPFFNLNNFKKSIFKTSLHYDNVSELPVFNLMKLHGSLTWERKKEIKDIEILFDNDLSLVKKIQKLNTLDDKIVKIKDIQDKIIIEKRKTEEDYEINVDDLMEEVIKLASKKKYEKTVDAFIGEYEKLSIINPTKEKFKETILNRNYYELLRIYSNELEKENTILFVMGFSFADEHIKDITIRALNSNPTLKIIIFSHSDNVDEGVKKILDESNNNNIEVIVPPQNKKGDKNLEYKYNLKNINDKIFAELLNEIEKKENDENE